MGILIVIVAIILVVVIQLILSRRGLKSITAQIDADLTGAEPEEEITITLTIRNGSWLMRPYIGYNLFLPEEMQVHFPENGITKGSIFLWPRSAISRKFKVSILARGNYRYGKVILKTGDFLGMKEESFELSEIKTVSVYPRRMEGADISKVTGGIQGDQPVRRFIFEDPVLFTGFREYTGREPMKDISWLQSARTGTLMVRQYDHTSHMSASVIIDTYDASPELIEAEFSIARDVCMQLDEKGIEYSVCMNAALGGSSAGENYISTGMGSQHLHGIYMQLANALYICRYTDSSLIQGALKNERASEGYIIITSSDTLQKRAVLQKIPAQLKDNICIIYADKIDSSSSP